MCSMPDFVGSGSVLVVPVPPVPPVLPVLPVVLVLLLFVEQPTASEPLASSACLAKSLRLKRILV